MFSKNKHNVPQFVFESVLGPLRLASFLCFSKEIKEMEIEFVTRPARTDVGSFAGSPG